MSKFYTKEDIRGMLLKENQQLTEEQLKEKTLEIHRALNTLDVGWRRKNKQFYSETVSFEQRFEKEFDDYY